MRAVEAGSSLTDRELQILGAIADGWSAKEAARTLGITPRTVECHLDTARMKLAHEIEPTRSQLLWPWDCFNTRRIGSKPRDLRCGHSNLRKSAGKYHWVKRCGLVVGDGEFLVKVSKS